MDYTQLTSNEMKPVYAERWDELIIHVGGNVHLARMLQVNINTANAWGARKKISKDGAKLVGDHNSLGGKFTAEYLRPDLGFNK
ncbi:MAG: hypothetical protein DRP42_05005 [Tenericutes bacterium]|nr:MAG: hypothetical protein DRP42_05005 [Mycoplasmatota bacterium]